MAASALRFVRDMRLWQPHIGMMIATLIIAIGFFWLDSITSYIGTTKTGAMLFGWDCPALYIVNASFAHMGLLLSIPICASYLLRVRQDANLGYCHLLSCQGVPKRYMRIGMTVSPLIHAALFHLALFSTFFVLSTIFCKGAYDETTLAYLRASGINILNAHAIPLYLASCLIMGLGLGALALLTSYVYATTGSLSISGACAAALTIMSTYVLPWTAIAFPSFMDVLLGINNAVNILFCPLMDERAASAAMQSNVAHALLLGVFIIILVWTLMRRKATALDSWEGRL